jgi:lipopolysaccharide/colanic/teichoic acid biosynthesis glycosyltransferase
VYNFFLKRIFDLIVSLTAFVLLLPLSICVFVLLGIRYGSPLFKQVRPGKNGRPFTIIKFRTMNDKRDSKGNLLPDVQRLTGLGKWVRKTSMDEIPQLINVIRGDMSLVGPRPLLMEYLTLYSAEQARRHEVRPGITGWAQVNGRNAIGWSDKFQYDLWYVNNLSFSLDVRILFMTIVKVFKAEGISSAGVATAEKFNGKN